MTAYRIVIRIYRVHPSEIDSQITISLCASVYLKVLQRCNYYFIIIINGLTKDPRRRYNKPFRTSLLNVQSIGRIFICQSRIILFYSTSIHLVLRLHQTVFFLFIFPQRTFFNSSPFVALHAHVPNRFSRRDHTSSSLCSFII